MTMPDPDYSLDGWDGPIVAGGVSDLHSRTEANVRAAKENELAGNDVLNQVLAALFQGLRTGISFPLAIVEALVQRLFGVNIDFGDLESALAEVKKVPILGDLVEVLSGIEDGDLNDLGTWFNTVIIGGIQGIIDGIVNALTGGNSTGNDLTAVLWALNPLNWAQQGLQAFWNLLDPFLAQLAGIEGRLTAAEATLFNTGNPLQYDSFNRDDIGPWTSVAGTLSITDRSRIQVQAGLAAGYIGTTEDVREPATDKHGIHIKLVNQWDGVCRGVICSNDTMTNYAAIEVCSSLLGMDTVRIGAGSSPSVFVPIRQMDFGLGWLGQGLSNGTVFSLKYDPDLNTYYVFRNNQIVPELTWVDEGNLVFHGPSKRKTGLVSNGDNVFGYTGFGITDFTWYDW